MTIISSLATILVNRLVLNLRERAASSQLPTALESAGRFRAALPVNVSRVDDFGTWS